MSESPWVDDQTLLYLIGPVGSASLADRDGHLGDNDVQITMAPSIESALCVGSPGIVPVAEHDEGDPTPLSSLSVRRLFPMTTGLMPPSIFSGGSDPGLRVFLVALLVAQLNASQVVECGVRTAVVGKTRPVRGACGGRAGSHRSKCGRGSSRRFRQPGVKHFSEKTVLAAPKSWLST